MLLANKREGYYGIYDGLWLSKRNAVHRNGLSGKDFYFKKYACSCECYWRNYRNLIYESGSGYGD